MSFTSLASLPNAATVGLTAALGMAIQAPAAQAQQANASTYLVAVGKPIRNHQGSVVLNTDYSITIEQISAYECPSLPVQSLQPNTGRYTLSLDQCRTRSSGNLSSAQVLDFMGSGAFTHVIIRGMPYIQIGATIMLPNEQTMSPPWRISPFMQEGNVIIAFDANQVNYCSSTPRSHFVGTIHANWRQRDYTLQRGGMLDMSSCVTESHILSRLQAQQTLKEELAREQSRAQQLTAQDIKNKAELALKNDRLTKLETDIREGDAIIIGLQTSLNAERGALKEQSEENYYLQMLCGISALFNTMFVLLMLANTAKMKKSKDATT